MQIKIGEYYWTTPDDIYGLMRKTLIYVTAIKLKTFEYLVADWKTVFSDDGEEIMGVYIHYPQKRRGKLSDVEDNCFFKCPKEIIVDNRKQ